MQPNEPSSDQPGDLPHEPTRSPEDNSGIALIGAAVVLGIAVLGSAFLLSSSIDRASHQLEVAVNDIKSAKPSAGAPTPTARPGRPDPNEVYEVAIGSAPIKGPKDAKVTIVEFSDFQCPFCGRVGPTLEQLRKDYPDDLRIVFKHLPLSFHKKAPAAHAAAEAAGMQGKFWEMHDRIFGNQRELEPAVYERYAKELGLDLAQYKKDLESKALRDRIDGDLAQARKLSVSGTPAFFVNGRYLSGAQPITSFKRLIDEALEKS